jgi:signal transduction histidine kinase
MSRFSIQASMACRASYVSDSLHALYRPFSAILRRRRRSPSSAHRRRRGRCVVVEIACRAGRTAVIGPHKWRSRLTPLAVFVVVAALGLAGFLVTRATTRDQERRLLRERAGEVSALLSSTFGQIETALHLLEAAYGASDSAGPGFTAAARSLVQGNVAGVGAAAVLDDRVVALAGEGDSPAAGTTLDGERAAVARRALAAGDVASGLVSVPSSDRLSFVLALGGAGGTVVYQESVVDPARPIARTPGSPFHDVDVALYRTPKPDPEQLLITTTADLLLPASADRRTLPVGAEQWLMVTSAPRPLAGSFASAMPWIILASGLTSATLAAAIVQVLVRRRNYALALVEQRTSELAQGVRELEAARAVADAANRSKSEFLSRMSHELRTPLNAVLGFAQVLEFDARSDEDRDAVTHIIKGGNHLLQLINEVLDISRIETGDLTLSPEAVLVGDLVADVLDLVRPIAAQQSVHLLGDRAVSCAEFVFADRQRLKQVLLNLLSNAVKYNRRGGTVAVSWEHPSPTRLRISVTDTGPGIPAEQMGLLFVPFERLGAERTTVEGTGIGLAISQRLADAMGGSLHVESVVGRGSTFSVELPSVEGPVERYERLNGGVVDEEAPAQPSGRHTVLYIEDNLANLKLVERLLAQRSDVEVIPSMQGRLGLELAREHDPALILLDLHLPDVSGDEVLQQLRDDPATASIPVVIISADATQGQVQRLLAAGAIAYLTKPFDVRELLSILDGVLAR